MRRLGDKIESSGWPSGGVRWRPWRRGAGGTHGRGTARRPSRSGTPLDGQGHAGGGGQRHRAGQRGRERGREAFRGGPARRRSRTAGDGHGLPGTQAISGGRPRRGASGRDRRGHGLGNAGRAGMQGVARVAPEVRSPPPPPGRGAGENGAVPRGHAAELAGGRLWSKKRRGRSVPLETGRKCWSFLEVKTRPAGGGHRSPRPCTGHRHRQAASCNTRRAARWPEIGPAEPLTEGTRARPAQPQRTGARLRPAPGLIEPLRRAVRTGIGNRHGVAAGESSRAASRLDDRESVTAWGSGPRRGKGRARPRARRTAPSSGGGTGPSKAFLLD